MSQVLLGRPLGLQLEHGAVKDWSSDDKDSKPDRDGDLAELGHVPAVEGEEEVDQPLVLPALKGLKDLEGTV